MIFVTFLFGAGQPMLFPIAFVGLVFTYFSERLRMAYSYLKPPMYDSRLSSATLEALTYAPVFYVMYSAWLFSNQQVFRNKVPEIESFDLYPLNGHRFSQLFNQTTPGSPFVVFFFCVALFIIMGVMKSCCCQRDDGETEIEDLVVIESLEPFFSMLNNKDREFWFREETVCRDRVGLKRISN